MAAEDEVEEDEEEKQELDQTQREEDAVIRDDESGDITQENIQVLEHE